MAVQRFTAEMVVGMLQKGLEGEDGIGPDSESEISDEDNDPAYVSQGQAGVMGVSLLNEEDSSDDQEGSSDESPEEEIQTQSDRFSKNGSYWNENPPTHGRTKSHNILRSCPGPTPGSVAVSPKDAPDKFISDNIIEEVLKCTNLEGRRAAAVKGKDWKSIDKEEFLAFIGLTLLAGGDKSWDVALRELFLDPLQNPIYKATMGVGRYENIRRFLRFDDRRTRALRLETDHMAAFRYVWECFLDKCRRRFIPSDCVTIDEQLVPFRGRCRFLQYMPSKPAKYGLKIFWMCDARVPYTIDGTVYTGRQPGEEIKKKLGETVVQQLCSGIRGTGRNITMDNFFTSVPLAEKLLEKDLTIVGTRRQNKADIPPVMKPSKLREIYSSEFGFRGNMTMVSYVPKKGKSVVLLSTMHDDKAVDESNHKKKPDVILFYNQTKGGVDIMDQMVSAYTCKRRTRRWPMVLWSNMLDVATLNALASFTSQHPGYMSGISNARRLFIKELGQELVTPHMKRRMESTPILQKPIVEAMGRCGIIKQNPGTTQPQEDIRQGKRKRCAICTTSKDRKASSWFSQCTRPVCKEHRHVVLFGRNV
ncbi:piggyBac transposable element-derived protein 4-like [Takifugu flavidus]|uniref:piggyBac transposable element-derived protein 4-like n=1 Tax=Takifugu flavidus TaxID=433684 RepID=UPI0025448366|nr:piggyBac transposable element-derived protein 4-like [Takifugu flavidus]